MSSLRSNNGPRIKYTPEDSPYDAITVDKLTPIIGGEISGVDLRDRATARWTKSTARWRRTW